MRSFVLILVVLGLSISSVSHAGNPKDLKNPPPSKGESGHPKQKNPPSPEKPTQQDNRGTEDNPIVIKGIPSQKTSQEAAEDREDRNKKTALDQELNFYTGGQALFTALTFFAVSAQIGLFVWQLRLIKRSSIDTRESAKAALLTAQHMQTAERAYVKISHSPPGLTFIDPPADAFWGATRSGEVRVQVSNIGKTPAIITSFVKTHLVLSREEPLPQNPPYDTGATERQEMSLAMYGTDSTTHTFVINLSREAFAAINANTSRLYLLIYADYIDQFEVRHRAGYARRYDPASAGNNLVLVTQRGYNYDRERKPGEGDDWNEPA